MEYQCSSTAHKASIASTAKKGKPSDDGTFQTLVALETLLCTQKLLNSHVSIFCPVVLIFTCSGTTQPSGMAGLSCTARTGSHGGATAAAPPPRQEAKEAEETQT